MLHQRFLISGKVQGVFFRKYTQAKALELKLNGAVRNLSTGQVEAWASGEEESLMALEKWLWTGSPMCAVTNVEVFEAQKQSWEGFQIIASA